MTMVHMNTKAISRKAGQSAVACAAYRAGDVLYDKKYGKWQDYGKKAGVMSSDIVMPFSLRLLGVTVEREALWNAAEAAETRSDSRVAREWLVNLPYELPEDVRKGLALSFAEKLADECDVIADVCIHEPVMKLPFNPDVPPSARYLREGEVNPDPRNYHAHILVTTRAPEVGVNGSVWFNPKLKVPFEWSNKKRLANGLPSSMQEIKRIRELWVETANVVLKQYGLPLMDARSYKDQGLEQQPTIKMGVEATAMERRGIRTEKGDVNRAIIARNQVQQGQQALNEQAIINGENEQRVADERRARELRNGLAWATEQHEKINQRIGDTERRVSDTERCITSAEQGVASTASANERLTQEIDDTKQRVDGTKQSINSITSAIGRSDSEIDKAAERSARPAPSPFDDAYRRAFLERKGRADRAVNKADYETRRHKHSDEREAEFTRNLKYQLATRLCAPHDEKWSLQWGFRETAADYPDKYDYRQTALLKNFTESLVLPEMTDDAPRSKVQRISELFTADFIDQHKAIIAMLRDPKPERAEYERITADFHTFISELDTKRAVDNKVLQRSLGSGETSRMTADTMTATTYLNELDKYINRPSTAEECKVLAREHTTEVISKTCKQYKFAYQDLKDLNSNESIQQHLEVLDKSVTQFITGYRDRFTEKDVKEIREGLKVLEQKVEIRNNYRPSFRPR